VSVVTQTFRNRHPSGRAKGAFLIDMVGTV
jgi:hypothetical protein